MTGGEQLNSLHRRFGDYHKRREIMCEMFAEIKTGAY